MKETKILTAGDSSLLIQFGQEISPEINAQITAFVHLMREQHLEGVTDVIPAFTSLLINYDQMCIRDSIRFVPVSESDFANIKNEVDNGTYTCTIHPKEV